MKQPPILWTARNRKHCLGGFRGQGETKIKKGGWKSAQTQRNYETIEEVQMYNNILISWFLMPDSRLQNLRGCTADGPRWPLAFSAVLSLHERFMEATMAWNIIFPITQSIDILTSNLALPSVSLKLFPLVLPLQSPAQSPSPAVLEPQAGRSLLLGCTQEPWENTGK